MITYVNTVLVSTKTGSDADVLKIDDLGELMSETNEPSVHAGRFLIFDMDIDAYIAATNDTADPKCVKIGLITSKNKEVVSPEGMRIYMPIIKWSNVINKSDLKAYSELHYSKYTAAKVPSEDVVTINFSGLTSDVAQSFAQGGKRVIVRLTFKDLPTRFRKWTESYEYVTTATDDATTVANTVAKGIAATINKQWKRARVTAVAENGVVTLMAMPYDDDNTVDSINVANKVRFTANIYYTDPEAAAFASRNKYFPTGVTITKTPGVTYPAAAKIVRDHEAQAMGYEGILNRGCCTWPIIKPDMAVDLSKNYDGCVLEFENSYHTADDLHRRTKQSLEIYVPAGDVASDIWVFFTKFAADVKTADVSYAA